MTPASYIVPGEFIAAGFSTLIVALIALAVALSHVRERLARLEEWVRLHEDPWA